MRFSSSPPFSTSCPHPGAGMSGKPDRRPGLGPPEQRNPIGTAFIASPACSRRMVSFEGRRGSGGVKNNINKLNRNTGGQPEGPSWGVWGGEVGDPGQLEPLSFQPPEWRILQEKMTEVSQRQQRDWPQPDRWAPRKRCSLGSHILCGRPGVTE